MRILYVEDNQANVYLVRRVAIGHEVINYIDGEEALAKITKHDPHLILMDIQLAGPMTGLDVVKTLRARGIETPIIAVTAYAMVGDRERCIAAGCDDYLAKPLPITRLIGLIKKYSEMAEARLMSNAEANPPENATIIDTESKQEDTTPSPTAKETETAEVDKTTTAERAVAKAEEDAIKEDIKDAPRSDITGEALIIDVEAETKMDDTPEVVVSKNPDTKDDTTATT